jgi:hypothetical protein
MFALTVTEPYIASSDATNLEATVTVNEVNLFVTFLEMTVVFDQKFPIG